MTKILVTGATGNVSAQIVDLLLERGADVRAGVRNPTKAERWAGRGVEVVRYDHDDEPTLDAAYQGVDRAFVLVPFVPGFSALAERAVAAARAGGTSHLVKLSAQGADPSAELWLAREHGRGDELVERSGLGFTILRPTFFQDNVFTYSAETVMSQGTFIGAAGTEKAAYVSTRDIASVAVEALLNPDAHSGRTYDLTGGEALSNDEVAALLTEATKRSVTYTDLTAEQYAEALRSAGLSPPFVEAMAGLERIKANGWARAVSPHVEEVLGRQPERYADFMAREAARLLG